MKQINGIDSTLGLGAMPCAPPYLPGESTDWLSNADLLAQADLSTDPVTQELACRYAAALAFLHNDSILFSPTTTVLK